MIPSSCGRVVDYIRTVLISTARPLLPIAACVSLHLFTWATYNSVPCTLGRGRGGDTLPVSPGHCLGFSGCRADSWSGINTVKSTQRCKNMHGNALSLLLFPVCGFLVIISDIRVQHVVCGVSRPHRPAEFIPAGRGCLWERRDQSHNRVIAQPCFTHSS